LEPKGTEGFFQLFTVSKTNQSAMRRQVIETDGEGVTGRKCHPDLLIINLENTIVIGSPFSTT